MVLDEDWREEVKTPEEWATEFVNENSKPFYGSSHEFIKLFVERVQNDTALYAVQALNSDLVKRGLLRWVKSINSKCPPPLNNAGC